MRTRLLLTLAPMLLTACPGGTVRPLPNDPPVAVAAVGTPDAGSTLRVDYVSLGAPVTLDGSRSVDPDGWEGEALDYAWSLAEAPAGSGLLDEHLEPLASGPAFVTFVPDVEGTYRIELVVTDVDDAVSAPATVHLLASPADLLVELRWDTSRADLDLHLLAEDGDYFGVSDCFSWNPNPNWGDLDLAVDDPLLDADDDGEAEGPYAEQIHLPAPQPGTYRVLVHYFEDHGAPLGAPAGPADPTLSVRAGGEPIQVELTAPTPLLPADVWMVGLLQWPEAQFIPLGALSDHASEGGPPYNE